MPPRQLHPPSPSHHGRQLTEPRKWNALWAVQQVPEWPRNASDGRSFIQAPQPVSTSSGQLVCHLRVFFTAWLVCIFAALLGYSQRDSQILLLTLVGWRLVNLVRLGNFLKLLSTKSFHCKSFPAGCLYFRGNCCTTKYKVNTSPLRAPWPAS